jgi:hypothetical protein
VGGGHLLKVDSAGDMADSVGDMSIRGDIATVLNEPDRPKNPIRTTAT